MSIDTDRAGPPAISPRAAPTNTPTGGSTGRKPDHVGPFTPNNGWKMVTAVKLCEVMLRNEGSTRSVPPTMVAETACCIVEDLVAEAMKRGWTE